jgi:hypothetical protein
VKFWLGAVKQDLCMLTAPCQILTFKFLCFYVYHILCIVEHPYYWTWSHTFKWSILCKLFQNMDCFSTMFEMNNPFFGVTHIASLAWKWHMFVLNGGWTTNTTTYYFQVQHNHILLSSATQPHITFKCNTTIYDFQVKGAWVCKGTMWVVSNHELFFNKFTNRHTWLGIT